MVVVCIAVSRENDVFKRCQISRLCKLKIKKSTLTGADIVRTIYHTDKTKWQDKQKGYFKEQNIKSLSEHLNIRLNHLNGKIKLPE